MAEIPLRVYIAPTARPGLQVAALELSRELGRKSKREWLNPSALTVPDEVRTAIVVGGDGSLLAVANAMSQQKEPGVVVSLPAGSQNGVWRSLDINGGSIGLEDLMDVTPEGVRPFHPLRANERMSLNLVAVGDAALTFCRVDERLRGTLVPRNIRMPTAGVVAAFRHTGQHHTSEQEPLITGFVTASDYGGHEVFPGQDMYHPTEFTQITVPQMLKREALVFSSKIIRGIRSKKPFPEDLLQLERRTKVVIPHTDTKVNIGGDDLEMAPHTNLTITRDPRPIHIVALTLPKKSISDHVSQLFEEFFHF